MKKIVPFKKDITLDTNVAEINSISLEHTLEKQENNIVSGSFIVSGTYKMNQTSVNVDSFEYKLPVNITIDKKYNIDDVVVDINDFYYEIINGKVLQVSIEVSIDNLEEKEVPMEQEEKIEIEKQKKTEEKAIVNEDRKIKKEKEAFEETKEDDKSFKLLAKQDRESDNTESVSEEVRSIFSNIDDSDNYVVYKIHIVTETDTIESIMEEYQTNREAIEKYNDLSDVKIGDKIIIADAN